jgi:outer membrane lipoprotein-sorting protein
MANPRAFLILLAVLVCLVSLLGPACAAEFSAEFSSVSVINGASSSTTGITYVRGHSFRSETVRHHQRSIMILDGKEHMLWFLDPARKTYYGEKVPGEELAAKLEALTGMSPEAKARTAQRHGISTKRLGTEKVAGYPCEKTVTEVAGVTTTTWFSKRLGLALRTEGTLSTGYGTATTRTEYRNVKERKLDPSLFKAPTGYTQVSPPARRTGRPVPKRGASAPAPRR